MIIGVTGGMGAGKSFVTGILARSLQLEVLDADILCRNLLQPEMPGWLGIHEKWGTRFFDPAGNIDRPVLRNTLFTDMAVRHGVEQILHPLVRGEILRQAAGKKACRSGMVVEVPLLFEVGWQADFEWVVVVYADRESCLQRIVRRDRVSSAEAIKAVSSQIPLWEKALCANSVIENSGPLALTILQVCHLSSILEEL
jgi:dephospho-CoA kinase